VIYSNGLAARFNRCPFSIKILDSTITAVRHSAGSLYSLTSQSERRSRVDTVCHMMASQVLRKRG